MLNLGVHFNRKEQGCTEHLIPYGKLSSFDKLYDKSQKVAQEVGQASFGL